MKEILDYSRVKSTNGLTREQLLELSALKDYMGCATDMALRAQSELAQMDNCMYGIGNRCYHEMNYIPYGDNNTSDNR